METKFNLFDWRNRLEAKTQEIYAWSRIAKEAGVHPNTVSGIATNKATRIDKETVNKLVNFFRQKGIDVKSGDLFVDVPVVAQAA